MSSKQVVKWFKVYRDTKPNKNIRHNPIILDFTSDEDLGGIPLTNAIDTVQRISNSYKPPYTLFISGGVDSQAMLWAWFKSGIPFSAVHYSYGANSHDTTWAKTFCNTFNIPLEIREFDVHAFINSPKLMQMAKRYDCASPQILTYIEFTKNHPETCIMAGNFIQAQSAGINWTVYGLERFASLEKPNFIPFFFLSSPRLAYSFYNADSKFKFEMFSANGFYDDYQSKIRSYQSAGFPVIAQTQKFTGFEQIKIQYDPEQVPGSLRIKWANMPSKRPFDILYRYSLFDSTGGKYSDAFNIIHHCSINK